MQASFDLVIRGGTIVDGSGKAITNLRNEGPHRTPNECSQVPIKAFEYYNGQLSCFFSIDRYKGARMRVA